MKSKRCVIALIALGAVAATTPSDWHRARASDNSCARAGYGVVSRSNVGVVLASVDRKGRSDYSEYLGCLFARRKTIELGGMDISDDAYLNHFAWHGTHLAWFNYTFGQGGPDSGFVSEHDLRRPQEGVPWLGPAYSEADVADGGGVRGTIKTLRVRSDGAVAWIGCPFGRFKQVGRGSPEPYYCSRKRNLVYEVRASGTRLSNGGRTSSLLAAGATIRPASLRWCGHSVCWIRAGSRESAPVE
jgi:hypothetical protein